MMFSIGSRKGWPEGWSQPAPVYNKYTQHYEPMPIQWVKGRKALQRDIEALQGYYGGRTYTPKLDEHILCGKRNPAYTTAKRKRQAELGYNLFQRVIYQ